MSYSFRYGGPSAEAAFLLGDASLLEKEIAESIRRLVSAIEAT
jgi:hypothetical protein